MAKIFSLRAAAEVSAASFLAWAVQRDAARRGAHAREAAAGAGKSVHLDPPAPRSPEELEAEGLAAFRRAAAFAASPRGRLLQALAALADQHPAQTEAATAAYARGLTDPAQTSIGEIGRALTALGGLAAPAGRAACIALSELLADTLGPAAE